MFSILVPTYNNLEYLKICIESIEKNSKYDHQIIVHINEGNDGTLEYVKDKKLDYTLSTENIGMPKALNRASTKAKFDYIVISHDDFYFCPEWDLILNNEIEKIGHKNFYLSGTMMNEGPIKFDCGNEPSVFDENKFLTDYKNHNYFDYQGSTWAPSLVHKEIWNKVGGLSEEFFPGNGSDPDFNIKLWNLGVRIFKGINDFKVYHFGSIVLRKKLNKIKIKNKYGSKSSKLFLLKWGISIKFFKRFYLRSTEKYDGPLSKPIKNVKYLINLVICKLHYLYLKIFYKNLIKNVKK